MDWSWDSRGHGHSLAENIPRHHSIVRRGACRLINLLHFVLMQYRCLQHWMCGWCKSETDERPFLKTHDGHDGIVDVKRTRQAWSAIWIGKGLRGWGRLWYHISHIILTKTTTAATPSWILITPLDAWCAVFGHSATSTSHLQSIAHSPIGAQGVTTVKLRRSVTLTDLTNQFILASDGVKKSAACEATWRYWHSKCRNAILLTYVIYVVI